MALQVIAVLALGLMCGSELNVAVFAPPTLNRLPLETHILVRASLARLLGRMMPFSMAGSTILNLYCCCSPSRTLQQAAWLLAAVAFAIQALAIPSRSLGRCRSTTESSDGRRSCCPTIGNSNSIAGTCITGFARAR